MEIGLDLREQLRSIEQVKRRSLMIAALEVLAAALFSLHPTAAGRVYAAYGGVYIFMAIVWLWAVDGVRPTVWDLVGSAVALVGMAIIMFAPRAT